MYALARVEGKFLEFFLEGRRGYFLSRCLNLVGEAGSSSSEASRNVVGWLLKWSTSALPRVNLIG